MSLVAQNNQRLKDTVLKLLYYHQPISLAELSKRSGKSLPVVSVAVSNLVEDGIVVEQGFGASTGGRRPQVYLLNAEKSLYTVSVSLDQYVASFVVYDLIRQRKTPIYSREINLMGRGALEVVVSFLKECIEKTKISIDQFLGMGIGMPGFVDPINGINNSFLKPIGTQSLASYLSSALDMPVFIDNDSRLIALAELHFGLAQGKQDALVVNLGWGTGMGLILNGQLYRGSTGYAGEFSHIPLANHKEPCVCGKLGCIEVETSLKVMADKFVNKLKDANGAMAISQKAALFFEALGHGDAQALNILADAGYVLGKGLATLMHILNPANIILSGFGARLGNLMMPSIQMGVNEFSIPRIAQQTTIQLSEIYNTAQLLAASGLVVDQLSVKQINLKYA